MFKQSKLPIRKLWTDLCTIVNHEQYIDDFGIQQLSEKVICENEPCRLSFSSIVTTDQGDFVNSGNQKIKLFIREDLEVKKGSTIIITRGERTTTYNCSSEPALHSNHQEIILNVKDVKTK